MLSPKPCGHPVQARAIVVVLLMAGLAPAAAPPPRNQTPRLDRVGDPLPKDAVTRLGTLRFRHRGHLSAVALSPDGRFLATGNSHMRGEASVALWEVATGRQVRFWTGHAHVVWSVAFSPDSKRLVSLGGDAVVHVWDIATGKEVWQLRVSSPEKARFTPDGKILVVTDRALVRRWDVSKRKELPSLRGHDGSIYSVDVSSDSKTCATCSTDKTVRVWDEGGKERLRLRLTGKWYGLAVALAPDGKRLACGTGDGEIYLWEVATGKQLFRVQQKSRDRVWSLAFSPDGTTLASAGAVLRLWDASTGAVKRKFDHAEKIDVVAFTPDGKRLVSGGASAAPRWWDVATGKEVRAFAGHHGPVRSAGFSIDGTTIATASEEPFVRLWYAATGKPKGHRAGGGRLAIRWVAFCPDGKTLATSAPWHDPTLWDLATGRSLRDFGSRVSAIPGGALAFSADGKTLAASTGSGTVLLWDTATARQRPHHFEAHANQLGSTLFQEVRFVLAPDGKTLAAARSNRGDLAVVLWTATTGKEQTILAPRGLPAAFAPNGRTVAVLDGNKVRVVDLDGKELFVCTGDARQAACAVFSADGRSLATAGEDGVVRLWELATGKRRYSFAGHKDRVNVLVFSPDGFRLASGSEDLTVLVWDLGAGPKRRLTAKEGQAFWADLAGDAAVAYRAIRALAAAPDRAVPLFRRRLQPLAVADSKRCRLLIAALDSDDFAQRERASTELRKLGYTAAPLMRQTLAKRPALEMRLRLRRLLAGLKPSPEELRCVRAIEALERLGSDPAREILARLAKGAEGAPRTEAAREALKRLAARRR
jgi:WD40 repeat protein